MQGASQQRYFSNTKKKGEQWENSRENGKFLSLKKLKKIRNQQFSYVRKLDRIVCWIEPEEQAAGDDDTQHVRDADAEVQRAQEALELAKTKFDKDIIKEVITLASCDPANLEGRMHKLPDNMKEIQTIKKKIRRLIKSR